MLPPRRCLLVQPTLPPSAPPTHTQNTHTAPVPPSLPKARATCRSSCAIRCHYNDSRCRRHIPHQLGMTAMYRTNLNVTLPGIRGQRTPPTQTTVPLVTLVLAACGSFATLRCSMSSTFPTPHERGTLLTPRCHRPSTLLPSRGLCIRGMHAKA